MGCDIIAGVIRSNEYLQIATLGMSMMRSNKEEKSLLEIIEYAHQKSLSPKEGKFVYFERRKMEVLHVVADDKFTIILIGKSTVSDKEIADVMKRIKTILIHDPDRFLICSCN